LLFSREQYQAAVDAYLRGIERRVEVGLDPFVASVASVFVSRDFLPEDGGDVEQVIGRFAAAGVDLHALGTPLQAEGADAFVGSWDDLIENIGHKASVLATAS